MQIKVGLIGLGLILSLATPVLAGGGLIELSAQSPNGDDYRARPGQSFTVKALVHVSSGNTPYDGPNNRCKQCPVTFKFQNQFDSDKVEPLSDKTDDNGEISARMTSNDMALRYVYVDAHLSNGQSATSSVYTLYFTAPADTPKPTAIPTIKVYPSIQPTSLPKPSMTVLVAIKQTASASANVKEASSSQEANQTNINQKTESSIYKDFFQGLVIWVHSVFSFFK